MVMSQMDGEDMEEEGKRTQKVYRESREGMVPQAINPKTHSQWEESPQSFDVL